MNTISSLSVSEIFAAIWQMKTLILAIGVVYLAIGIDQYMKGEKWALGLYAGYAFANVALFMMAK